MPRRTVSLPESTDALVREIAYEDESFSAAVTRLVEAGARSLRGRRPPSYVGVGDGPKDLGRKAEAYLARPVRAG